MNNSLIYHFGLRETGLAIGAVLAIFHALALMKSRDCGKWLKAFPRSVPAGLVLIALAVAWSLLLVRTMDLGEFAPARGALTLGVIAGTVLSAQFMKEFLAVRALGMLLMLAADPLLSAAFLRPEPAKILLVLLAYAWILAGLFWVGMPWLMRDQITWLLAREWRFRSAGIAGLVYGAAIFVAALAWK